MANRFKILESNPFCLRDNVAGVNYHLASTEEARILHSLLIELTVNPSNHTVLLARLIEENGNLMDQVTRLETEVEMLEDAEYMTDRGKNNG